MTRRDVLYRRKYRLGASHGQRRARRVTLHLLHGAGNAARGLHRYEGAMHALAAAQKHVSAALARTVAVTELPKAGRQWLAAKAPARPPPVSFRSP